MIAFIDDHREAHGVEPICKVLPTAPSTYYDHVARRRDPARPTPAAPTRPSRARARRTASSRPCAPSFSTTRSMRGATGFCAQYQVSARSPPPSSVPRCRSSAPWGVAFPSHDQLADKVFKWGISG